MSKPIVKRDQAQKIEFQIKGAIASSGYSITSLAAAIVEHCNRPESAQSLSKKLKRGSIKYAEVLEIADILGYIINWDKKKE